MARYLLIIVVALSACRTKAEVPTPLSAMSTAHGDVSLAQLTVEGDLRGISGMAPAGDGTFWIVPERDRRLFRIAVTADAAEVVQTLPIRGAPDGQDLESVALWASSAPPGRLLFGTETTAERTTDSVIVGNVGADAVVLGEKMKPWALEYGPWQVTPGRNRGLEALCVAGPWLLAVSETVKTLGDARLAPVALRRLSTSTTANNDAWHRFALRLTSVDGKISAVTCRTTADGRVLAIAIERHYGIMRLIRFALSPDAAQPNPNLAPVTATSSIDLAKAYGGRDVPNFEGIVWLDDDRLLLVSDNDYGGVAGPTLVLRVTFAGQP